MAETKKIKEGENIVEFKNNTEKKQIEVVFTKAKGKPKANIVFAPGAYHNAKVYLEYYAKYFSEKGYNVYAMSFRGDGISTKPSGEQKYSLKDFESDLKDVSNLVEENGLDTFIGAHSMAGPIAQSVFQKDKTLDGLFLLASSPLLSELPENMKNALPGLIERYKNDSKGLRKAMQDTFFVGLPKKEKEKYINKILEAKESMLATKELFDRNQLTGLEKEERPVTLISAKNDGAIPVKSHINLAKSYGNGKHFEVAGPHDLMLGKNTWKEGADVIIAQMEKELEAKKNKKK